MIFENVFVVIFSMLVFCLVVYSLAYTFYTHTEPEIVKIQGWYYIRKFVFFRYMYWSGDKKHGGSGWVWGKNSVTCGYEQLFSAMFEKWVGIK